MNIHEKQFSLQKFEIQKLINHSKIIPRYHAIADINYYSDWCKILILSREEVQQQVFNITSDSDIFNRSDIYISKTSGSSGKPIRVARSLKLERLLTKQLWTVRRKWSKDIMDWKLMYLYRNIESSKQNILRLGEHKDYLNLSDTSLGQYIDSINNFSPDWLIGPPIAVTRLAQHYEKNSLAAPEIKLAELYGEMLYPYNRNIIEKIFSCKVINHYGAREFGVLSYECPFGSMHAWTNHYFFEVLDENRVAVEEGEVGELYITSLTNFDMPLIRYALGDLVRIKKNYSCPCGSPYHICIEPVGGRVSNLVYLNEKILTSAIFDIHMSRFMYNEPDTILEYQVIQYFKDEIEINIKTGESFNHLISEKLESQLLEQMDITKLVFKFNESIITLNSGKTPTFISYIDK